MTPDLNRLSEPFGPSDLEWRVQRAGEKNGKTWAMLVAYITNRAIMDRLDEVCGPGNWRNDFREGPGGGVLCGISIRVDDEWVTKWDGAENTDIEAVKGGLSGAMKRAGVQWGMGRYLYRLEEAWANVHDRGALRGQWIDKNKNRHYFNYDPPDLPRWALPPDGSDTETGRAGERVDTTTGEVREDEPGGNGRPPRATEKQVGFVEKLCRSHVITEEERDRIARKMTEASKDDASEIIEWLQATIEERKAEADSDAEPDEPKSLEDLAAETETRPADQS